jgi:hypothetical protein
MLTTVACRGDGEVAREKEIEKNRYNKEWKR